ATAATDVVGRHAGLAVTKTGIPTTASTGEEISYTIVASNNGPSDAPNSVTVSDTIAPGTTFVRSNAGSGCAGVSGGSVTCTISGLVAGASGTITLTVKVNNTTPINTTVTNTVHVSTTGTTDSSPGNDSAQAPTD